MRSNCRGGDGPIEREKSNHDSWAIVPATGPDSTSGIVTADLSTRDRDGARGGDGARDGDGSHDGDGARDGDGTRGGDGSRDGNGAHDGDGARDGDGVHDGDGARGDGAHVS